MNCTCYTYALGPAELDWSCPAHGPAAWERAWQAGNATRDEARAAVLAIRERHGDARV